MLRLLLPPNLPAAALRDAIPLKIEFDPATPPPPAQIPALAVLSRLCGGAPTPPPFVQLTRAQLRELVIAFCGHPVFAALAEPQKNLLWLGQRLRGVSEHLAPATPLVPAPVAPAAREGPRSLSMRAPRIVARDEPLTPLSVDGSEHYLAIALPSREHPAYNSARELLSTNGFALDPSTRKWWLRDRHKVLNFLATHTDALRTTYHADFSPNFEKHTATLAAAKVTCEVTESAGEFTVSIGLFAGKSTEDQLRLALAAGRNYVESGKKIYLLPPAEMSRLAAAQAALAGGTGAAVAARRTLRVGKARIPELQSLLETISPGYQAPAGWRRRAEALRDLTQLKPAPMPASFTATLRPYQHIGVAWLWHLHQSELGGVLADEMGLGKTAQALAFLAALHHRPDAGLSAAGDHHPSLVVCPASLVENWRREAARFAPSLRVFVHHGNQRLTEASVAADAQDLIITSYGTLARDQELFAGVDLSVLIADEAQHVKNRRSQNARALRSIHAVSRILLTGTPVENSLEDLRALFELVLPGYVEKAPTGLKPGERSWHDDRLRKQTAPYILRRTKALVATELPPKIEQVIYCAPTSAQTTLYTEWQRKSEQELDALAGDGASEGSMRLATLTQLLRLRQICCDPRLVDVMADAGASSKLDAFRELLAEAVDDGHRLLVFSQFTTLLGLLRDELDNQGLTYCYLDGSTPQKQRQLEVDRYQNSPNIPVFLISLKAGGTGLNLTGADTIVHFDPWWNPAVEAQASDRAHRIGQTKVVTSYKLICTGTVEEKVMAMQETKRRLLADVFEASDAANSKLSLADLRDLLAPLTAT